MTNTTGASSSITPGSSAIGGLPVSVLRNPEKLKDLSKEKVKDGFPAWRNLTLSEFAYYGILPIIEGTHAIPNEETQLDYWHNIENLF